MSAFRRRSKLMCGNMLPRNRSYCEGNCAAINRLAGLGSGSRSAPGSERGRLAHPLRRCGRRLRRRTTRRWKGGLSHHFRTYRAISARAPRRRSGARRSLPFPTIYLVGKGRDRSCLVRPQGRQRSPWNAGGQAFALPYCSAFTTIGVSRSRTIDTRRPPLAGGGPSTSARGDLHAYGSPIFVPAYRIWSPPTCP